MARLGDGYGSECHLLRYLGRHRRLLDEEVKKLVRADAIEWADFAFDPNNKWPDAELTGLDFLEAGNSARQAWADCWPQRGSAPNWDAVVRVFRSGTRSQSAHRRAPVELPGNRGQSNDD